ncbi:MAG: TlpA family protein disulfide reductase [Actinomycetota bacterium]
MKPLTRREFFRASAFVALGAVAAACAKKVNGGGTGGARTLAQITNGRKQTLNLITGSEILSKVPDRLVFNMTDPTNGNVIAASSAKVWVATDQNTPAMGPYTATFHDDGLGERGFFETPITMPSDGTWLALAEVTRSGSSTPEIGLAQFQVGRQTAMPIAGDKAIVVPSPTYSDHRGVNPICTAKPVCSMHAISLDAALKNGKPTLLIIATPQFCQSALCGPEVDVVQAVSKEFTGKVNFVHVEVYRDDKATTIQQQILSPAAQQWRLEQEPAIYYIDTAGVIKSRTIGPADKADVRSALGTLPA